MTNEENGIEVRWLPWAEGGEEILALRRHAFTTEQGWAEDMVRHEKDPEGLHLCAVSRGAIVAVMSAYLYEPGAPELADLRLPEKDGLSVRMGKRVEAPGYRGRYISKRLGMAAMRQIYESLRPARFFLVLQGLHRDLTDRYTRTGFVKHTELTSGDEATTVMKVEGGEALARLYSEHRALVGASVPGEGPMAVPSLVRFLVEDGRAHLLAVESLEAENLYLESSVIESEMPRLIAQGRLMLTEQRARLAATPFPPPPASLLDIGTGPGGYLHALAAEDCFSGYRIRGVEPAPSLLSMARASFPETAVRRGSAYATGEEDSSHDVVTASFLFVHLRNPDLALLEMRRVLRPGGLLYVVDVNDGTFRGPGEVRRLVDAYGHAYPGDRKILADLPRRAGEFGFELIRSFATTVRNTGGAAPAFGPDEICIGREDAWLLLSFMFSEKRLEEAARAAQEHYFSGNHEMSVDIETQVYRIEK
ncbi:methyltransferase domain-containing protein [Planomonospora parontospora]|uniref:methyltransferase domain-containing protein n=1 Tax=Planomonospora parontospora TaxID=58119 RepID=UPI001670806D|nr:methyltransferase domain-containing protein [Planomonospora parontospora]GGL57973.1 hypothetical protein GCM10014719_69230 [Planomonospora parontospora subsp. antibiotica]GII20095.1 hypothetical protein Ppa05_68210 [Planomonospora parontospora subsp. antibiotica]